MAEWAALKSETWSQAETEETVCYLPVTEETNCIQRPGSFETSTALTINTLSGDSETIKDHSESVKSCSNRFESAVIPASSESHLSGPQAGWRTTGVFCCIREPRHCNQGL